MKNYKNSNINKFCDFYSEKAKKEGYPARSVYKLMEIQNKFKLFQQGFHVLDIGCAPGSWLMYASSIVGNEGKVFGIDVQPITIRHPSNTQLYQGDIYELSQILFDTYQNSFDVVMSDMAPSTSGVRHLDAARSFSLCEIAFDVASQCLKKSGSFVCKIFQGSEFKSFSEKIKEQYRQVKIFKPKSSRKQSVEIYLIGIDKK
ncbi:MAG: RlmE family RNA methyltransferase [Desulfobacterales bacterium]|nr:RlmE family RNA methyltransferase [Desulfobacterales bacterium]